MKTTIAETLIEWDDNKNRLNIRKHGISFETAALVFADDERIEYYDKYTARMKIVMLYSDVSREFYMLFTP